MEQTTRLGLPYVMAGQAQKHITVNESFRLLDALVQLSCRSASTTVEPANPSPGDIYILPAGKSGQHWQNLAESAIAAFLDNAWVEIPPRVGLRAWIEDAGTFLIFDGSDWTPLSGAAGSSASQFGINTTADTTNRLSVKADAELLSHDDVTLGTGDARKIINKAGAGNTASVVFQNGFSGRAEFGLTGDDMFHMKVSNDGAVFIDSLIIDPATGRPSMPEGLLIGDGVNAQSVTFNATGTAKWGVGIGGDDSFFIQKLDGGFGTGGKVIIYDANGALGLWGVPSTAGKISVVSNVNSDAVDSILYLKQTAAAVAPGVAHFHNNADNATPILKITTNTNNVLLVPASGSIEVGLPVRCFSAVVASLPSAAGAGAGSVIYVPDESGGSVLVFSDGAAWRRVTDRAIVS